MLYAKITMFESGAKTVVFMCMCFVVVNTEDSITETHEVVMNAKYDFRFKWRIDEDNIFIEMSANTLGYVAIGFSPNGGMPGSDIVVGWVRNGQSYLSDRHAITYSKPEADTTGDYTLLYGHEDGGRTRIGFKRALNTCDDKDNIINADTIRVIWAVNSIDPEDSDDIMYHNTSRGVRSIIILDSQQTNFTFPKDYNYFEGFMPNVTVPDNSDTTYWCYSFAVPTFENPVHIFRAETIVQEGHESLVHHLLVYSCRSMNMNWSSNCFSPNMPTDLRNCDRLVYGWAIGAEPLNFPEHVGISLGKENDPTVYFIELHYDNPGLSPDFHDNSGVRFYYTSTLRQYEAGVWQFGELVSPFQAIPPKEQLFKTFGICYGDCTRQALDVNINGFFVFLHSHLAGRQMKLQHYRNGHLIEDVGRDDNYDFNLQDARVLQPERVFKPGDDFVVTCGYNTADRDSITKGGLGTKDEMCVAYIYYYPKQSNAGACQSVPDLNEFNSAFNIECDTAECIYARLSEMDPTLVREGLHNVSYNGKRNNYCRDLDYNNIPGVEFYKDFPAWFGENDRIEDQNDVCSPTGVTGSSISIMPPGSIMLIMLFLARTVILTMK